MDIHIWENIAFLMLFIVTAKASASQRVWEDIETMEDNLDFEVSVSTGKSVTDSDTDENHISNENETNIEHFNYGYYHVNEWEDDREMIFDDVVPIKIYLGFIYIIYIVGVLSNVALFLLMQLRFHSASYSVYIRFLAVLDSLVLITYCTEDILQHQIEKVDEFLTVTEWFCKIWSFCTSVSRQLSPWFVVAFTFERFVSVVFPFHRHLFGTVKNAFKISLSILALGCGEAIASLVIFRIVHSPEGINICYFTGHERYETYFIIRNLFIETLIPCAIILILNINVIIGLNRGKSFRKAATSNAAPKSGQDNGVTITLVAVSLTAFATLTPVSIIEVVEYAWIEKSQHVEVPNVIRNMMRTWTIWNMVRLLNFGQNFYIFMLTSRTYRKDFVSMIRCEKGNQGKKENKGISK